MAKDPTLQNGSHDGLTDANGLIPGITMAEKIEISPETQVTAEPTSFEGPEVNGRATTVTKFSPAQLAKSPLVPSLYEVVNIAFEEGHKMSNLQLVNSKRLRTDHQLFDELGNAPGTTVYVVYYKDTQQVIATASGKRYLGRVYIADTTLTEDEERSNTWKRFGVVPEGTAAWELSTMAVDPTLQRQGLAGYLMKLVEDEVKRMFAILVQESGGREKLDRLFIMITTIAERNFDFYARRGFTQDYEKKHPAGWLGSANGFTVVHMTKVVDAGELLN